jgi:hypothetical protein
MRPTRPPNAPRSKMYAMFLFFAKVLSISQTKKNMLCYAVKQIEIMQFFNRKMSKNLARNI